MATLAERARQMLSMPRVIKKDAARAMSVEPSAVSRILRGDRKISADEFAGLDAYVRSFSDYGFEEPAAPSLTPTPSLSPIWPARSRQSGEWAIDTAATPIEQLLSPPPFQNMAEVYGFRAPDDSVWPRYKVGELVWLSPSDRAMSGDDVFVARSRKKATAVIGRVAEFRSATMEKILVCAYPSGEIRELDASTHVLLKIAPRDR